MLTKSPHRISDLELVIKELELRRLKAFHDTALKPIVKAPWARSEPSSDFAIPYLAVRRGEVT